MGKQPAVESERSKAQKSCVSGTENKQGGSTKTAVPAPRVEGAAEALPRPSQPTLLSTENTGGKKDKSVRKGAGNKNKQIGRSGPAVPAPRVEGGDEALLSSKQVDTLTSLKSGNSDIKGINQENDGERIGGMGEKLKTKVRDWAKDRLEIKGVLERTKGGADETKYRAKNESQIQKDLRMKGRYVPKTAKQEKSFASKIFEVASNFNTACVVLGDTNIKNRENDDYQPSYQLFYGQNQGYKLWKNKINEVLEGNLTTIGFQEWNPKNCAEVDAIQQATSAGVNLKNAHMYTVGADTKGNIYTKKACLNCTASFGSSVKDRNYSGWSSDALVRYDAKFMRTLNARHNTAKTSWYATAVEKGWCKEMDPKTAESARKGDRAKAIASREAIRNIEPSHK